MHRDRKQNFTQKQITSQKQNATQKQSNTQKQITAEKQIATERKIKQAIHIEKHRPLLNRDQGIHFPPICGTLLSRDPDPERIM